MCDGIRPWQELYWNSISNIEKLKYKNTEENIAPITSLLLMRIQALKRMSWLPYSTVTFSYNCYNCYFRILVTLLVK